MSTRDDKPNDYEHAVAEIERLQGILAFMEAASKAERDSLTAEIERQAAEIRRLRRGNFS